MHNVLLGLWKKLNFTKGIKLRILRVLNDEFLVGVTGVIFNDKHEVLLFKHSYREIEWSLPGGFLKGGEHPKQGLEREILEESGLIVKVMKIIHTTEDSDTARLDLSYFGIFVKGEFKASAEVVEYGFFPLSKLPELIPDQYTQIEEGYNRYVTLVGTHPFKKLWLRLRKIVKR